MGRKSTQDLIKKIIKSLSKNPKSIIDISNDTNLDRTAIVKYLNILKENGLLVEEQKGTSKVFTLVPINRTNTFFGLPLDAESEKKFNSLYHLIKKTWAKQTSKPLFKTHAQKIAYKVISECDLRLPSGWYLYGGIAIQAYDDSVNYEYSKLPKEVELSVKNITAQFIKNEHAWQSKKQQYEEEGNTLYLTKENILSILYGPKFNSNEFSDIKDSLYVLIKMIRKLISLSPKDKRKKYNEILEAYQDLMLDVTNKLDETKLKDCRTELITLFQAVWEYIALFNFKNDLKKYYSEEILDLQFKLYLLQKEDEIIELGTRLQNMIPQDEITDPVERKLKEALSQIKLLTPAETKKEEKTLEEYRKKYGLKALNEKLFKEFGLN